LKRGEGGPNKGKKAIQWWRYLRRGLRIETLTYKRRGRFTPEKKLGGLLDIPKMGGFAAIKIAAFIDMAETPKNCLGGKGQKKRRRKGGKDMT